MNSNWRWSLLFSSCYAELIKIPRPLLIFSHSDSWSRLLIYTQIVNGKQCRSRSVGFIRSQLIWICTVCKGRVYLGSAGLELILAKLFFSFFFFFLFLVFFLFIYLFFHVLSCSLSITKTYLYNFDPLKPHFYIVKLGFTGVYIIFLISGQKHRLWSGSNKYPQSMFLSEVFQFLEVKFSIYLHRRVFVMSCCV